MKKQYLLPLLFSTLLATPAGAACNDEQYQLDSNYGTFKQLALPAFKDFFTTSFT